MPPSRRGGLRPERNVWESYSMVVLAPAIRKNRGRYRVTRPGRLCAPAGGRTLERAEEVEQVLLVVRVETVVSIDHGVGLRRAELGVAAAAVSLDRLDEVIRAPVVQEEEPLAQTPERRGPKLVAARDALLDLVGEPGAHGVQRHVGVEIRALAGERRDRAVRVGLQGRRVAERTAQAGKLLAPSANRERPAGADGRRLGRRQEALEVGEVVDGIDLVNARGHVVGNRRDLAVRRLVTLLLKRLVGDPHLDVVGLAREDQQRLVLRLPAESRDRSVVAVPVRTPADSETGLRERAGAQVGDDRAVLDLLDQPGAEDRRGDPENDVVVVDLLLEVLLLDRASPGVRMPGDHEERVDAAVARTVGIELEPRFPDRTVQGDERRNDVVFPEAQIGLKITDHTEQGVHIRARAADGRRGMAARAAHEVEAWAEAVLDCFLL